MPGQFIISLDCEGKWGMADKLSATHHQQLTNENLSEVYQWMVATFDQYRMPATFAFVLALLLNDKQRLALQARFQSGGTNSQQWLSAYNEAAQHQQFDGWHLPALLPLVKDTSVAHEIACHGFSHLPLHPSLCTDEEAREEFESIRLAAAELAVELTTLVYPRNLVGYTSNLIHAGIKGYRGTLMGARTDAFSRLRSLLREFNVFQHAQDAATVNSHSVEIPPGHILNFKTGLRSTVPGAITVQRWKSILNDAAKHNRTALLWLHPHNLITDPGARNTFSCILAHAAKLRDSGDIRCITQAEYCASMAPSTHV